MVRVDFLRTFINVAEKGSLKKVAEKSNMSISSISFQVNSVEKFYDAKLLNRGVNGVSLTDEGKVALENMKLIIESIDETRTHISNIKGEKITIATGMVGLYVVPQIQNLLKTKYPDVEVNIVPRGAHECIEKLKRGEVDFIIVGDVEEKAKNRFKITELGTDRLILITPSSHPLNEKSKITLTDVVEYPFVFLTEDYGITSSLKKALVKGNINMEKLKKEYVVDDFFSQLHSVSNGLGIAITSLIASWRACEIGLVKIRNIEGFESKRSIYFITSKLTMESEKMKEYAEFIVENSKALFSEFNRKCVKL